MFQVEKYPFGAKNGKKRLKEYYFNVYNIVYQLLISYYISYQFK